VGKKKDSPRGKECFGVREFTQLWVRSIERQRGRRDAEVTRGNVSGVARGNVVEIPKLLEATQEKKAGVVMTTWQERY